MRMANDSTWRVARFLAFFCLSETTWLQHEIRGAIWRRQEGRSTGSCSWHRNVKHEWLRARTHTHTHTHTHTYVHAFLQTRQHGERRRRPCVLLHFVPHNRFHNLKRLQQIFLTIYILMAHVNEYLQHTCRVINANASVGTAGQDRAGHSGAGRKNQVTNQRLYSIHFLFRKEAINNTWKINSWTMLWVKRRQK
jgi:hypothetical protein